MRIRPAESGIGREQQGKFIILENEEDVPMIGKVQPKDGMVGQDVKFDRIRRITGYLVGTTDRFNNAKRAEERDRVKHAL